MEYSDIVKYWQKQHIKDSDDLRNILNGHIINFAYHSGKIENPNTSYDDTREIFENDAVCNYTGDLRTLYEIRNAKDAINIVLDVFDKHQPLTEEFIKKIQYELTKNTYDFKKTVPFFSAFIKQISFSESRWSLTVNLFKIRKKHL